MNAGVVGVAVAHAVDIDGAKDGLQSSALKTAVSEHSTGLECVQRRTDIASAALLNVCLQQRLLNATALDLLRLFDLVQRQSEDGLGKQPALQRVEPVAGSTEKGGYRGGKRRRSDGERHHGYLPCSIIYC